MRKLAWLAAWIGTIISVPTTTIYAGNSFFETLYSGEANLSVRARYETVYENND